MAPKKDVAPGKPPKPPAPRAGVSRQLASVLPAPEATVASSGALLASNEKESGPLDRFAEVFVPAWLRQVNTTWTQHHLARSPVETGITLDVRAFSDAIYPRLVQAHLLATEQANQAAILATLPLLPDARMDSSRIIPRKPGAKPPKSPLASLPSLSPGTYAQRWLPLLAAEQLARVLQLKQANLYHVDILVKPDGLYILEARSIREGWPPVDLGDLVELRQLRPELQSFQGIVFEASVASINRARGSVTLRCDGLRSYQESLVFNVIWKPQARNFHAWRRTTETIHKALIPSLDLGAKKSVAASWLFPDPEDVASSQALAEAAVIHGGINGWVDGSLNQEQRHAVQSIVWGKHATPFLISGPPGTGKTKTLVEAVLQLLQKYPSAHILVCGASNPSADTLAMRLKSKLTPDELFRLNAPSRPFAEVRGELLPFCYVDEETNSFFLPPFMKLLSKKVIVTTCLDTSYLLATRCTNKDLSSLQVYTSGLIHPNALIPLANPHFAFLLVDEAAQASEPDLACALSVVVTNDSHCRRAHVTLCGDTKQLGPEIISEEARSLGLDVSLLERLGDRPVYKDHPYSRRNRQINPNAQWSLGTPFVDLTKNYRSCPSILMLPSTLFYNETLEAFAPDSIQKSPLHAWARLPSPSFSVWFHGVAGDDEPVDEGASFFNEQEVNIVRDLVADLVASGDVKASEISVISPFREQVWRVRLALRAIRLGDVDVGNVEALQGAENRVVIISTVRSRSRFLPLDKAYGRGLIHEPRRFNVALTRAKELLIVVGNAEILTRDPYWKAFYRFCKRNAAYTGPEILRDDSITAGAEAISMLEQRWNDAKEERGDVDTEFDLLVGSMARETLQEIQ